MNKETLELANKITRAIDTLDDLNSVIYAPYPQFYGHDREVNSACFDEETLKRLKSVIKDFIDDRRKELMEEFKGL